MNNKNNKPKICEEWVPIKGFTNGMIQLDNGYLVTGIKIEPKNIFILDEDSQIGTIISFRNLYNMIDFEFWLIVADKPVDINLYISQLQVLHQKQTSPKLRKLIMQDINKAEMFMNTQLDVSDTEYFILFRDKKPEILQKRINTLLRGVASCGLNASQVSNEDLRGLLDNFFNGSEKVEYGMVMPQ